MGAGGRMLNYWEPDDIRALQRCRQDVPSKLRLDAPVARVDNLVFGYK